MFHSYSYTHLLILEVNELEIKDKNHNTYSHSYLPLNLQISQSALANLLKPTIQGPSQLHQSAETNETKPVPRFV